MAEALSCFGNFPSSVSTQRHWVNSFWSTHRHKIPRHHTDFVIPQLSKNEERKAEYKRDSLVNVTRAFFLLLLGETVR